MTFLLDGFQTYVLPIIVGIATVFVIWTLVKGFMPNDEGASKYLKKDGDNFMDKLNAKDFIIDLAVGVGGIILASSAVSLVLWAIGGFSDATGVNVGI